MRVSVAFYLLALLTVIVCGLAFIGGHPDLVFIYNFQKGLTPIGEMLLAAIPLLILFGLMFGGGSGRRRQ